MFNATTTTPYTSTHSICNTTNTSQVVCVIDSKNQTQYPYLPEYTMDVSLFSYMYTLFLAFGCYYILNPVSARVFAVKTIFNIAKYTITGYGFFKERIYRPYMKSIHPKLLRLLNIDDGINEIIVIKNGNVIHSFKTMELFVKNNPIPFVKEFSDEDSDGEEQENEDQGQDQDQEHINPPHLSQDSDLSDKVDYNKKCEQLTELIEAFKSQSLDDTASASASASEAHAPETAEVQESEKNDESVETSETDETDETDETSDGIPDDYILDPTAYDFIIRNFYYEDEKTGEIHSLVFKYDIFYKSEMVEKYDIDMIKDKYFSTRKFIGISLKMNNQKYNINLTSPSNYYVSDNSILNYSFMKWYMMKHYYVKLSRDYVISCIDNYVEMYRINPGKKIIVHKNKFQLVDDETFNSDSDSDNDSDEHTDADADVHVDSDTDTDNDNHSNENDNNNDNDNQNQNGKNKEPRLVIHNNLEESHEMCDIEILDYD
jgi:hypothetical protein